MVRDHDSRKLNGFAVALALAWVTVCSTPRAFAQGVPSGEAVDFGDVSVAGMSRWPFAHGPWKVGAGLLAGDPQLKKMQDLLVRDLELSGYFKWIPDGSYAEDAQSAPVADNEIDFSSWRVLGVNYLIKTSAERVGDRFQLEFRLHNVPEGHQALGRKYEVAQAQLPAAVHDFANRILEVVSHRMGAFGTRIVFVSNRGKADRKDIYVIDADGSNLTRLTYDDKLAMLPDWSPSGSTILYTSYRSLKPDLWLQDVSTGRPQSIVSGGLNTGGSFSPDGRRIAFSKDGNICVVSSDGSGLVRLTQGDALDVSPSWSPDGNRIVFVSDRAGRPHLYVMNSDGSDVRKISTAGMDHGSPKFSPDGERIAFEGRPDGWRIFTINVDGSGARQVSNGPGNDEHPSWSPDSRTLVYSSGRGGSVSLVMVSALGGNPYRLTDGKAADTQPDWGPMPQTP